MSTEHILAEGVVALERLAGAIEQMAEVTQNNEYDNHFQRHLSVVQQIRNDLVNLEALKQQKAGKMEQYVQMKLPPGAIRLNRLILNMVEVQKQDRKRFYMMSNDQLIEYAESIEDVGKLGAQLLAKHLGDPE